LKAYISDVGNSIEKSILIKLEEGFEDVKVRMEEEMDSIKTHMEKELNDLIKGTQMLKDQDNAPNQTPSESLTDMTPAPKRDRNNPRPSSFYIKEYLTKRFKDLNEEEINVLYNLFERSCDDVLKSYQEIDKSHLELLWTDIPTTDKLNLYRLALNDAVKMEGRLSVLGSCVRLWACEFCLQAKWSQKAQYQKRVRLVFLLISHEKMMTLSYTQVDANVKKNK
jgi:hypothetical protein